MLLRRALLMLLLVAALVAPAAVAAAATPTASASPTTPSCVPPVIAHRGLDLPTADQPEDTYQAELEAASDGANVLNVNVEWTSDRDPVALHDFTIDRTTTGSGDIYNTTEPAYVALYERYENGTVDTSLHPQTLYTLLAGVASTNLPIIVQMESDPLRESWVTTAQADAEIKYVLDRIVSASVQNRTIIAAWQGDQLLQFEADATAEGYHIPAALLSLAGDPSPESVLADGATILDISDASLTAPEVQAWHAAGLEVFSYTPDSATGWALDASTRVDGITTDDVPGYETWAAATCAL